MGNCISGTGEQRIQGPHSCRGASVRWEDCLGSTCRRIAWQDTGPDVMGLTTGLAIEFLHESILESGQDQQTLERWNLVCIDTISPSRIEVGAFRKPYPTLIACSINQMTFRRSLQRHQGGRHESDYTPCFPALFPQTHLLVCIRSIWQRVALAL